MTIHAGIRCLTLLLGLATGPAGAVQVYSFTNIHSWASSVGGMPEGASINNAGMVAYSSFVGTSEYQVWRGNGTGAATRAGRFFGEQQVASFTPTINSAGTLAFTAPVNSTQSGVWTIDAAGVSRMVVSDRNGAGAFGQALGINDAGAVTFDARGTGDMDLGVYVVQGGQLARYAPLGYSNPDINNLGMVAFHRGDRVYVGAGGPAPQVAGEGGIYRSVHDPLINDAMTVAFGAVLQNRLSGIYTVDIVSDVLREVATTAGPFDSFGEFSLNASGKVAFLAQRDDRSMGIYTSNEQTRPVIAVGNFLFGSFVTGLDFSRDGLNDGGQIAFSFELADGRRGVARAAPLPVPSTLALMAAVLPLGFGVARARRRG